jgi:hypothetical protein
VPRGNDPTAAQEFQQNYQVNPNCEYLIAESKKQYTEDMRRAALTDVDDSQQIDHDEAASKLDLAKDDVVLDAVVRGDWVSVVFEDGDGVTHKRVYLVEGAKDKHQAQQKRVEAQKKRANQRLEAAARRK